MLQGRGHIMVKSLNEHRENIKSEVRTAARAKAKDIVVEISLTGTKKVKERRQPVLAENRKSPQ